MILNMLSKKETKTKKTKKQRNEQRIAHISITRNQ
jgi:hypothetical protein